MYITGKIELKTQKPANSMKLVQLGKLRPSLRV